MTDAMRWRYGDINPVTAAVDAETVIEVGDLLRQDDGKVAPAASDGAPAAFKRHFLGVAMQRSHLGDTAALRVATSGVFAFDCPSDTFELGDWVACAARNRVIKTADREAAIGRVARREPHETHCVLVAICSTVMAGGI